MSDPAGTAALNGGEIVESTYQLWVCPSCGFAFEASHVNTDGSGYSCPACEVLRWKTELRDYGFHNPGCSGAFGYHCKCGWAMVEAELNV